MKLRKILSLLLLSSLSFLGIKQIYSAPFRTDVLSNGQKTVIVYFDHHHEGNPEYSQELFSSLLTKVNLINIPINFLIEGLETKDSLKFNPAAQFQDLPSLIHQSPIKLDFLESFDWIETNKQTLPSYIKFYDVDLKCRKMFSDFWKTKQRIHYTDYFYDNLLEQYSDYDASVEEKIPEEIKKRFKKFAAQPDKILNINDYFTDEELAKYKNLTFVNLFETIREELHLIILSLNQSIRNNRTKIEPEINEVIEHVQERIQEWIQLLMSDELLKELTYKLDQQFSDKDEVFNLIINFIIPFIYWGVSRPQESMNPNQESKILKTFEHILGSPDAALCRMVDISTLDHLTNEKSTPLSVVFLGGMHANQVVKYLQLLGYKTINQIPATNLEGKEYADFYSAYYDSKNIKLLEPNCFDLILSYL